MNLYSMDSSKNSSIHPYLAASLFSRCNKIKFLIESTICRICLQYNISASDFGTSSTAKPMQCLHIHDPIFLHLNFLSTPINPNSKAGYERNWDTSLILSPSINRLISKPAIDNVKKPHTLFVYLTV